MEKQGKQSTSRAYAPSEILLWILSGLFLIFLILLELGNLRMPTWLRILNTLLVCLPLYLSALLHRERTGKQQLMNGILWVLFAFYLYLLLSFTLLDPSFGRQGGVYPSREEQRVYYLKHFVNLVPFYSIYHVYIRGFLDGRVHLYYLLLNLVGNLVVFMPFGLFLPRLWKLQRKWFVFLPTVILSVLAVEFAQFFFMIGSCDIDDLILNTAGATIVYFLLKLPLLSRAVNKLF